MSFSVIMRAKHTYMYVYISKKKVIIILNILLE